MSLLSTIGSASARAYGFTRSAIATATDAFFNRVTLLLNTSSTNGAQNNTFLDSGTANSGSGFTITRNGNVTQGTFTPFSQTGWSNNFPGSSYFTRAFTSTTDGMYIQGSTYTIEAWVYPSALSGTQYIYICNASNVASYGYNALYLSGTSAAFATRVATSGTEYAISGGTVALNQWAHIAVSVSANSAKLFLNGTQVGITTTIAADTFTPTGAGIGQNQNGAAGGTTFTGYISNLRITQGGALYTGNFTPSTTPLTTSVSSGTVSFLTAQSNRFLDTSSNAYTLAITGTPSIQAFSPFAPTIAYDTTTVGGSGYFDGSGDYLSLPANAAFNFGAPSGNTNDFTIEMWIYPTGSFVNYEHLYGTGGSGAQDQFNLYSNGTAVYYDGTTSVASPALNLNQWNHVAVVRYGAGSNNLRVYGNGVSGTPATSTLSVGSSVLTPRIGLRSDGLNPYQGYISNLRIVKGTAVYTANFTPPTSLVTAISGTSVLINSVNAGIYNAAAKNDLETSGSAQVSTTTAKFGTTSMKFNGTTDYLTLPTNNLLEFGTGDFTVETWVYFNSVSSIQTMITNYSSASTGWGIQWRSDTGVWNFFVGNTQLLTYTNTPSTNTWIHFAVARSGTSLKMFLNGTQVASTTNSTNLSGATRATTVGVLYDFAGPSYIYYLNGYLDELRITKGYARYTASFTAPTAAFPTQ